VRDLLEPGTLNGHSRVAVKELGHISMDGCLPVIRDSAGLTLDLGEGEFTDPEEWIGATPQLAIEAQLDGPVKGTLVLGIPLRLLGQSEQLHTAVAGFAQADDGVFDDLDTVDGRLAELSKELLDAVGFSLASICGGEFGWDSPRVGVVRRPDEYTALGHPVVLTFPVRLDQNGQTYALTLAMDAALAGDLSGLVLENDGSHENGEGRRAAPVTPAERVTYRRAYFQELGQSAPAREANHLDLLMDVPLEVTVELGRTRRQVREVLELGPGSVVELDKLAGEPVDIHINGRLIARGEVVVVEENFGVRITDIVNPSNRIGPIG